MLLDEVHSEVRIVWLNFIAQSLRNERILKILFEEHRMHFRVGPEESFRLIPAHCEKRRAERISASPMAVDNRDGRNVRRHRSTGYRTQNMAVPTTVLFEVMTLSFAAEMTAK